MQRDNEFSLAKDIHRAIEHIAPDQRGDPAALRHALQRIQTGFPAEREFVALSVWLGNCVLIHGLEQDQFPSSSKDALQVPDLFAIYRWRGREIPVLIEVKTTTRDEIKFTEKDYERRRAYARQLKLPLLVAWKLAHRGVWFLFDSDVMERPRTAWRMELWQVEDHDLKGILLGDAIIQIAGGSKLVIRWRVLQRLSESQAISRLDNIFLESPTGQTYPRRMGWPLLSLMMWCQQGSELIEHGNQKTQVIYTLKDELVMVHRVLPQAIRGLGEKMPSADWLAMLRKEAFQWSYSSLLDIAVQGRRLGFVNAVMSHVPAHMPAFLAVHWRARLPARVIKSGSTGYCREGEAAGRRTRPA